MFTWDMVNAQAEAGAGSPWVGVVLAGGRSRRMGRDKASLLWHGRPLLQHMCALLEKAGAGRVVISGDHPQLQAVADRVPDLGPLGGIASVAETLDDGPILIVPVDMPRLSAGLLQGLVRSNASCACYEGHVMPLWIRLNAAVRVWLAWAIEQTPRQRSLQALHGAFSGISLPLPKDRQAELKNLNTPEQWRAEIANEGAIAWPEDPVQDQRG